jgi:hypothetical protein
MKLAYLSEPELEFGQGTHICPRMGITEYDVYDTKISPRRDSIFLGVVGTATNIENFQDFLEKCSAYIPSINKTNKLNLWMDFCGVNLESGFKTKFTCEEGIHRKLTNSEIKGILKIEDWDTRVNKAVELYYENIKFLAQNRDVDIIVCLIPKQLSDLIKVNDEKTPEDIEKEKAIISNIQRENDAIECDFRRLLKAKSMHLNRPIQIILEPTLKSNVKGKHDDATKAWNLCTAIYYKSSLNTIPWKIIRNINQPPSCFVGISFYRSRDKKVLNTSLAQLFDELGNSVILRGTPVDINKNDRQPHLKAEQAFELLKQALSEYYSALSNAPGRLVIHKTSKFNEEEIEGFQQAAQQMMVKTTDFITIIDTKMRLFRKREYPAYRGTHIELDSNTHLLYTRGAVEYYQTYTGSYVPQPLEIRIIESDESPETICQEILALTKMNWNNTQFDGKYPITISCSRKVGEIMKYLDPFKDPQISYRYYM